MHSPAIQYIHMCQHFYSTLWMLEKKEYAIENGEPPLNIKILTSLNDYTQISIDI